MATRPVFQFQGPASNCVIDGVELGWESCTAFSMAMLIDVATDGAKRPKGCRVRKLVSPKDKAGGLNLRQVAEVALEEYGVRVSVRTGANTVSTAKAIQQLRKGRGMLLQGNNAGFANKGTKNHAIWVNEVRGGTADNPKEALLFDPQRQGPIWVKWEKILDFAAELRLNDSGTKKLGRGRMYAGFPPPRAAASELSDMPEPVEKPDVRLRFGARKTKPFPDRTRANPPAGRRVNVRRRPDRVRPGDIVDTLVDGELFVARQRLENGAKLPGSTSRVWLGNRDGTEWVHVSGLRRVGDQSGAFGEPAQDTVDDDDEQFDPSDDIPDDIPNDSVRPEQMTPEQLLAEETATPDPDPDGDIEGEPMSDDEVAELPVEG